MRNIRLDGRLSVFTLSFAIAASTFLPLGLVTDNKAQAQNYNHGVQVQSGFRVKNTARNNTVVKRSGYNSGIIRDANNPVFQRRVLRDAIKGKRSGVRLGGIQKNARVSRNNDIRLVQRQIQINARNEEIARERELRRLQGSLRRTQPNGRLLTRQERINILNGREIVEEPVTVTQGTGGYYAGSACPSKHNCGYRIYSDGTGPRIITPGVGIDNGLPDYDGLNGPKIITLD